MSYFKNIAVKFGLLASLVGGLILWLSFFMITKKQMLILFDPLMQAIILVVFVYAALQQKKKTSPADFSFREGMKTGMGVAVISSILITLFFYTGIKLFFTDSTAFSKQLSDLVLEKGLSKERGDEISARITYAFRAVNWLRMNLFFGTFATLGCVMLLRRNMPRISNQS